VANWTAATLRNRVLERLGVKGRGQSAAAEDAQAVDDLWVSLYEQLLAEEHAPFTSGAVPEWAQQPLVKMLAGEAAPLFGFHGERLVEHAVAANEGRTQLQRQTTGKKGRTPIRGNFL